MKTGWLELLLIALAIMWLLNAYRKNSILRKVDKEMDRRAEKSQSPKKTKGSVSKEIEAEDVDYEEIK
jgi:heme exporter protein D